MVKEDMGFAAEDGLGVVSLNGKSKGKQVRLL